MNARRLLGLLCAVLVMMGTLAPAFAQDTAETVTVAFIGREASGRGATSDRALYQAAVTAADRFNAGLDDDEAGIESADGTLYRLDVVYYAADTLEEVAAAMDDLNDDDAVAVLMGDNRDFAEAAANDNPEGLPIFSVVPETVSDVLSLSVTPAQRAAAAADYWVEQRHLTHLAVIAADTEEALAAAAAFKSTAGDGVIVMDVTREADEDDFEADVRTLRDSDAEAVFIWMLDGQTIDLLNALAENGWAGEVAYGDLDSDFVARAGADLSVGLYGVAQWLPNAYDAASQTFTNAYLRQWGNLPTEQAGAAYDAVGLLAGAIAEVGDVSSALRSALTASGTETVGVQGTYRGTVIDAVRVVQTNPDGVLREVVRYAGVDCQTCPSTWLADSTDLDSTDVQIIRLGLIAPLSGASEAVGEGIEQAARLAIREVNDLGGVLGTDGTRYTLELLSYDAQTAQQADAALTQAQAEGVQIILGPDSNAQVIPNLFRPDADGLVQLVSATTDQATASALYQLRTTDTVLAEAAAHYASDVRDLTRFASVAVRTDYGLDGAEAFNLAISQSDEGTVVLELEHDVDQTDLRGWAATLRESGVEAVAIWTTEPAAQSLITELNAQGWDGLVIYGYLTPQFVSQLGTVELEVVGAVGWWPSAGDWLSADFTARYQTRYGQTPIPQAAAYYDAVYVVARGLQADGLDGLGAWLADLDSFTGVQGTYQPATYASGELSRMGLVVSVQSGEAQEAARYQDGDCWVGCQP
jgi:branched-chain amino acid transport system substrate-binding protein